MLLLSQVLEPKQPGTMSTPTPETSPSTPPPVLARSYALNPIITDARRSVMPTVRAFPPVVTATIQAKLELLPADIRIPVGALVIRRMVAVGNAIMDDDPETVRGILIVIDHVADTLGFIADAFYATANARATSDD